MSYKLSVPVMCSTLDSYGREKYVEILKSIGADRVFLCPSGDVMYGGKYDAEVQSLKDNIGYMKEQGFEVGVWVWTFQFRGGNYTYMKSPLGKESLTSVCPTDTEYRKFMGKFIQMVAGFGIDIFMFDDDFRYTFLDNGFSCCCDNHLKMISEELGEEVTLETMEKHLLHGGADKYRSAFIRCNGRALGEFAAEMRKYLDEVNPDIRMGFCSCISSWDMDGIHPDELSRKLAGGTRPFYRLIGAPYWAHANFWGNRLANVIEQERIEAAARNDADIEIFSEGDTYPRPRFRTPAAFLEGFDTALRASGCMDGILKYMIDYSASPTYENGYIDRHIRNMPLYREIDSMFSDKEGVGIRVYDKPVRYEEYDIPEKYDGKIDVQDIAFNVGSKMLAGCSLPAVHEGCGCCGIAFGEDIKAVPEEAFSKGLIIDAYAARVLMSRGIDVGIKSIGGDETVGTEIFVQGSNRVSIGSEASCKRVEVREGAVIESRFETKGAGIPASFRYENASGQRFLVFCFDAYASPKEDGLYRQYTRAEQIISAASWLGGKDLPAVITGCPEMFPIVKENGGKLAVGLWNFCPDDVPQPVVTLASEPKKVTGTIGCTAEICGRNIRLSRIEPYGFAAFEVEE